MPRLPSNPTVSFWRSAELPDIELRESRYRTATFRAHLHATYSIGLLDHGAADACVSDVRYPARAGQIVVIEPLAAHACHPLPTTGFAYRMFYIGAPWFALGHDQILRFPAPVVDDPALFARLSDLYERLSRAAHPGSLCHAVRETLGQLAVAHGRVDTRPAVDHDRPIRTICRQLTREPTVGASLATLAADLGMSRSHFSRAFKTEMGLTPHAFVSLLRVERAKRLLTMGAPIAAAAIDAGFSDQSHFARVFRRFAGATPAQYRAATTGER